MLVNGTIGYAEVMSSGTGNVYLLGTNTSVAVDLAGVSNVYLRNANGRLPHLPQVLHCNPESTRDAVM